MDDEYQTLGVFFESNDPTICVLEVANAVSPPNAVTGMTGGDIDFTAPLVASFFDGGGPAAVAVVTLRLTPGSGATAEAYDVGGVLLGDSGKVGEGIHRLSFPRLIHSVRITGGSYGMDDFSFTPPGPPVAVPALPVLAYGAVGVLLGAAGVRRLRTTRFGV